MLTAALFTTAKMGKQPKCSLTNECIRKIGVCVYTYMCVCVCVCVCIIFSSEKEENLAILPFAIHTSIDRPEGRSVLFSSVAQSCLTLCDPMDHSTPGLPVHHQHPEFTQIYIHCVGDAIQPSHPLSSPSPPAFNLSQH